MATTEWNDKIVEVREEVTVKADNNVSNAQTQNKKYSKTTLRQNSLDGVLPKQSRVRESSHSGNVSAHDRANEFKGG